MNSCDNSSSVDSCETSGAVAGHECRNAATAATAVSVVTKPVKIKKPHGSGKAKALPSTKDTKNENNDTPNDNDVVVSLYNASYKNILSKYFEPLSRKENGFTCKDVGENIFEEFKQKGGRFFKYEKGTDGVEDVGEDGRKTQRTVEVEPEEALLKIKADLRRESLKIRRKREETTLIGKANLEQNTQSSCSHTLSARKITSAGKKRTSENLAEGKSHSDSSQSQSTPKRQKATGQTNSEQSSPTSSERKRQNIHKGCTGGRKQPARNVKYKEPHKFHTEVLNRSGELEFRTNEKEGSNPHNVESCKKGEPIEIMGQYISDVLVKGQGWTRKRKKSSELNDDYIFTKKGYDAENAREGLEKFTGYAKLARWARKSDFYEEFIETEFGKDVLKVMGIQTNPFSIFEENVEDENEKKGEGPSRIRNDSPSCLPERTGLESSAKATQLPSGTQSTSADVQNVTRCNKTDERPKESRGACQSVKREQLETEGGSCTSRQNKVSCDKQGTKDSPLLLDDDEDSSDSDPEMNPTVAVKTEQNDSDDKNSPSALSEEPRVVHNSPNLRDHAQINNISESSTVTIRRQDIITTHNAASIKHELTSTDNATNTTTRSVIEIDNTGYSIQQNTPLVSGKAQRNPAHQSPSQSKTTQSTDQDHLFTFSTLFESVKTNLENAKTDQKKHSHFAVDFYGHLKSWLTLKSESLDFELNDEQDFNGRMEKFDRLLERLNELEEKKDRDSLVYVNFVKGSVKNCKETYPLSTSIQTSL